MAKTNLANKSSSSNNSTYPDDSSNVSSVQPASAFEKSGWLQKWTNYVKGYRQRWFVLDSLGNLNYYRSPNEVNSSCRGSINLREARILSEKDNNQLIVAASSQTFHLKAQNEVDRSQWLKALEYARHRARVLEDDEDENYLLSSSRNVPEDVDKVSNDLNNKLAEMQMISSKIEKASTELNKYASCTKSEETRKCAEKVKEIQKSVNSLIKKSDELVTQAISEYKTLARYSNNEYEQRQHLQEQIETLARQHSRLEREAFIAQIGSSSEKINQPPPYVEENNEDDETFHDATDDFEEFKTALVDSDEDVSRKSESEDSSSIRRGCGGEMELHDCIIRSSQPYIYHRHRIVMDDCNSNHHNNCNSTQSATATAANSSGVVASRQRRASIPPRPDCTINLWSIMRNCIGKELTKIPMPVNFNEPLSFLQRLTEDLEYSYLLDRAAEKKDSCEQLAYIAAYAISGYSTTAHRTTKPFNPLLGETFEFDRSDDLGWRCIAEQVSHHPPIAAHHAESKQWRMFQETQLNSRFRGKYLSVVPAGYTSIHFKESGAHYTYRKVTTTVHNIIVGKLWIDNHGEMCIENHTNGDKCIVKFSAYSYFSTEKPRKINGIVKDKHGKVRFLIQGFWDKQLNIMEVKKHVKEGGKDVLDTGAPRTIWTANQPYPNCERMHNFTRLAIELNEEDASVAPTDSRRRPDQRAMELGNWDEANRLKNALEEKQRRARRNHEAEAERSIKDDRPYVEYQARWFERTKDPYTGAVIHTLIDDDYWKCKARQDWSRCPDIYL